MKKDKIYGKSENWMKFFGGVAVAAGATGFYFIGKGPEQHLTNIVVAFVVAGLFVWGFITANKNRKEVAKRAKEEEALLEAPVVAEPATAEAPAATEAGAATAPDYRSGRSIWAAQEELDNQKLLVVDEIEEIDKKQVLIDDSIAKRAAALRKYPGAGKKATTAPSKRRASSASKPATPATKK